MLRIRMLLLLVIPMLTWAAEGYPSNKPPMLGVNMSPPPMSIQKQENLRPDEGVYVRRVYSGTAAERMGMQRGDVVLSINGQPIGSMSDVRDQISSHHVGSDVQVQVRRNGQEVPLSGTLGDWPEAIPKTPINSAAEQRYRSMQERRLEREARRAAQQLEAAEESLGGSDSSSSSPGGGQGLSPLQRRTRQRLAEAAGSDLGRIIAMEEGHSRDRVVPPVRLPDAAAMLPPWQLRVRIHPATNTDTDDALEAIVIDPDPVLSTMAPLMRFSYAISTDSEAL
ncbi:MAG: S1C family serine protease [Planctomycetota bacterium]